MFLSDLGERLGLAVRAGKTFGGKRDVDEALGYKAELRPNDFRLRWKRGGIAARIVEAMPKACWRGEGILIEDENPAVTTEFEGAWEELNAKLNIWSTFQTLDILAGLGQFAVLLIGAPGKPDTELSKTLKASDVAYLSLYGQDRVTINDTDYEIDPLQARFGQPNYYTIKYIRNGVESLRKVHWTRIIHVADETLEDPWFGASRLERVWNKLDDLDKVTGGGSEAFWKRVDQGINFRLDPTTPLTTEGKAKMEEQLELYEHGLKKNLRTRGMDVLPLQSDVSNFGPQADAILKQIAGATGIPQRILTGSEVGELASTQDRSNWAERVNDRRMQFCGPRIVKPFVQRMIEHGVFPKPKSETLYTIRWAEIQNLNQIEQASVASTLADVNQKTGKTVATVDEIRVNILGWPKLEAVDPEAARKNEVVTSPQATPIPGEDGQPPVTELPDGAQPDSPPSDSQKEDDE